MDNLFVDKSYFNRSSGSEWSAMLFEFKVALNSYLEDLVSSPVRSLEDVIGFNNRHKAAVSDRSVSLDPNTYKAPHDTIASFIFTR